MTNPQKSSDKKVIFITGCSSGFGMLAASYFAKDHHVVATMRNLEKKSDLLNAVEYSNATVDLFELDVTKPETIKKVTDEILERYGRIDVLINNAGYGCGGFFEDLTDNDIRQNMEVNFFGVQNVIREVLHSMRPARKGTIINVSSVAGLSASPCFGAYAASKYALEGFSESLHQELKIFGINVCCVNPGPYRTKIFEDNARYAENFNNPQSPYFPYSQFLKNKINYAVKNSMTKDPIDVVKVMENIINTPNPKLHYFTDLYGLSIFMLKRLLPESFILWLKRQFLYPSKEELSK